MPRAGGVAIIGFGGSELVRRSDRGLSAFALDAAIAALADAGLQREQVDGYVGAPWAPHAGALNVDGADEIGCRSLLSALGMTGVSYAIDLHKAFAPDMVASAAAALVAGHCRYVLGVRALSHLPAAKPSADGTPELAWGAEQFTKPFGAQIAGARFAMRLQRYMARSAMSRRDLYEVVALGRRHAAGNPFAVWRDTAVSLAQYLDAPMVASPHCVYDCDMPVNGAAAFVMSRTEDIPPGAAPAYVSGWAGHLRPHDVFARSRLQPADVDTCQLYDGFSSMLYEWLEAFGWAQPDTAWRFVRDGHANADGKLPVNTFGGSLGEGRLHGIGHLREGYLQVTGRAGPRQLRRAEHCLVQVGPFDSSSFVMLSAAPRAPAGVAMS